ncbi:hypothetical protein ACOMHN_034496 [Nucella lapillus]
MAEREVSSSRSANSQATIASNTDCPKPLSTTIWIVPRDSAHLSRWLGDLHCGKVKDRKLRALPPKPPDARERLLQDIRARPKLNPVRHLLQAAAKPLPRSTATPHRDHQPCPGRKVIKPDFTLLLSDSFEDSDVDSEGGESPEKVGQWSSPLHCSPHPHPHPSLVREDMNATWHTGLVGSGHEGRGPRLQRRHTITICESPIEGKLAALQELPPVEEEEEPSPTEDQTPRFHYGADSLLSGLPDHTLHNGNNLLRGGAGRPMYRSEHRRSLTTGLTAIPEDEDATDCVGGGSGGAVCEEGEETFHARRAQTDP